MERWDHLYLDHRGGYTTICLSKFIELAAKKGQVLPYKNLTSKKRDFKKEKLEDTKSQQGPHSPASDSKEASGTRWVLPWARLAPACPQRTRGVQQRRGAGPPGPGTCSPASGSVQLELPPEPPWPEAGACFPSASRDITSNLLMCPRESRAGPPAFGASAETEGQRNHHLLSLHPPSPPPPTATGYSQSCRAQRREATYARSHSKSAAQTGMDYP